MAMSSYLVKSMKAEIERKAKRRNALVEKRNALDSEISIVSDEISHLEEMLPKEE